MDKKLFAILWVMTVRVQFNIYDYNNSSNNNDMGNVMTASSATYAETNNKVIHWFLCKLEPACRGGSSSGAS